MKAKNEAEIEKTTKLVEKEKKIGLKGNSGAAGNNDEII